MGKRIGNFTNPTTGETDWVELDTVNQIILQPNMVTKVGDVSPTAVDFKLDYNETADEIRLTANYKINERCIKSEPVIMDQEKFISQLADKVYGQKCFDEADIIISSKEKAISSLNNKLTIEGIFLGGVSFSGFGFVMVDGDKVLTIEKLDFNYEVQSGTGIKTAVLHNCVGQASLKNLDDAKIEFYTDLHKITMTKIKVESDAEGRIKQYNISVGDMGVLKNDIIPEHKVFEEPNFDNDEFLNAFIEERKTHLDDNINSEDIDNRFDDLLEL